MRDFRSFVQQHVAGLGLPACAVPGGIDRHGVPVGVQLTGLRGGEARVLAAARAVQP